MNHNVRSALSAIICTIGAVILTAGMSRHASAQTFQRLYGGAFAEAGTRGARPILHAPFGYIAAGMSYTPSAGADADIYIVRTNANGGLVWARTFNIGGDDIATDIIECANGDFVLVGFTNNRSNCCDSNQIFLMRVSSVGNLVWDKTYGGLDMDFPSAVIESRVNDPVTGSGAGDLIIAGYTNSFGSGYTHNFATYIPLIILDQPMTSGGNAYMMRTESNGTLKWGRTYSDTLPYHTLELFNSVAEITQGPNAGDLVAVGYTTGFRCPCSYYPYYPTYPYGPYYHTSDQTRGLIVRTDRTGRVDPVGHPSAFSKVYSYPNDASANNVRFNSVSECVTNPNLDAAHTGEYNFIVAGESSSLPYALYLDARGAVRAQATYAPSSTTGIAACVREITYGAPYTLGNFILCGYITGQAPAVFGGQDAFALELGVPTPGFAAPVWSRLYGGAANDLAASIAPVPPASAWGAGGYILDGSSLSFTNPNKQLYLVKTNIAGVSGCNEKDMLPEMNVPLNHDSVVSTDNSRFRVQCNGGAGITTPPTTTTQLCFSALGKGIGDDGITIDEEEVSRGAGIALGYYPNPIGRGEMLHIRYTLPAAATVNISVTDILGREVESHSVTAAAGESETEIETARWAAGSYLIKITLAGRTDVRRVVVVGK